MHLATKLSFKDGYVDFNRKELEPIINSFLDKFQCEIVDIYHGIAQYNLYIDDKDYNEIDILKTSSLIRQELVSIYKSEILKQHYNELIIYTKLPNHLEKISFKDIKILCGDGIDNLHNIHKMIDNTKNNKTIIEYIGNINSHILGLILLNDFDNIVFPTYIFQNASEKLPVYRAFQIIKKYIDYYTDKDILECQEEMISAGLKSYAKL